MSIDKPPYLPPQLLNIVLNKDTSARVILFEIKKIFCKFWKKLKCEPALLPEPNHVMLKHLYALSIRVNINYDLIG